MHIFATDYICDTKCDTQNVTHKLWHTKCDTQNVTHRMWRAKCDTQNVTHKVWAIKCNIKKFGAQNNGYPTQLGKHKRLKAQKMNDHRFKTYSGHHILSYHSAQNTLRAYVGKPTCWIITTIDRLEYSIRYCNWNQ